MNTQIFLSLAGIAVMFYFLFFQDKHFYKIGNVLSKTLLKIRNWTIGLSILGVIFWIDIYVGAVIAYIAFSILRDVKKEEAIERHQTSVRSRSDS